MRKLSNRHKHHPPLHWQSVVMCCCVQVIMHLSACKLSNTRPPSLSGASLSGADWLRKPLLTALCRSLQGLVNQFGRWLAVTAVAKPMFLRKLFHCIMEPGRNEPNRGLTRQQIHDILVGCSEAPVLCAIIGYVWAGSAGSTRQQAASCLSCQSLTLLICNSAICSAHTPKVAASSCPALVQSALQQSAMCWRTGRVLGHFSLSLGSLQRVTHICGA